MREAEEGVHPGHPGGISTVLRLLQRVKYYLAVNKISEGGKGFAQVVPGKMTTARRP